MSPAVARKVFFSRNVPYAIGEDLPLIPSLLSPS
jgi:hypothetical protein